MVASIRNGSRKTPLIAGTLVNPFHHSGIGNNKRNGLKSQAYKRIVD
jgi:hypothetical protein